MVSKFCILGPRHRYDQVLWLLDEAKKLFDKAVYVPISNTYIANTKNGVDVIYKKGSLSSFDVILPRIPRTYRNYGYIATKLLSGKVVLPFKPESVYITHNKFLTLVALDRANVPIPKTYLASTRKAIESMLAKADYPVVIKLLYGSLGTGVMFAETKKSAIPLVDVLESMKEPVFVEEFLENPGEDIRALVIGDEVVASMKRSSKGGDMRANIGAGGVGKKIKLSTEMQNLAVSTAKALKLGIAGVDIIETANGPFVIEANVNVHFEGITKATGVNVAKRMVEYMREKYDAREKKDSGLGFWDIVEGY